MYKEHYDAVDNQELEKVSEEQLAASQPADGEEPLTENEKLMISLKAKFQAVTKTFYAPDLAAQHKAKMERLEKEKLKSGTGDRTASAMGSQASMHDDRSTAGTHHTPLIPEQWQDKIRDFRNIFVIKYPRIIQTLFYLLKFRERDYICERGTNKLSWKKAKVYINDDLFAKMGEYWPYGPKDEDFREYERLRFIQTNLKGIHEDAVDEYSVALGKLYRWLQFAIDIRLEDIRQRREHKKELRAMRAEAQEKERER